MKNKSQPPWYKQCVLHELDALYFLDAGRFRVTFLLAFFFLLTFLLATFFLRRFFFGFHWLGVLPLFSISDHSDRCSRTLFNFLNFLAPVLSNYDSILSNLVLLKYHSIFQVLLIFYHFGSFSAYFNHMKNRKVEM